MTHKCNPSTLGSTTEERNFGSHCLYLVGDLEQSAPSWLSNGIFVIIEAFHDSNKPTLVNFDEISEADLDPDQMTGSEMHNQFTYNGVCLFICSWEHGGVETVFLNIDTQHHGDDVKFFPKRGADIGRKVKERFSNASAHELCTMLFGKASNDFQTVLSKRRFALLRIFGNGNPVNAVVNRVVGVMHRETYFDSILLLEEAGGYAQIQFLLKVSAQDSGGEELQN